MAPDDDAAIPANGEATQDAFDKFGLEARIEARMLQQDVAVSAEDAQRVIDALNEYRGQCTGNEQTYARLAQRIGVAQSTLVAVLNGSYQANTENILRKIDEFLSDEQRRAGTFDASGFATISLSHRISGAIGQAIKRNSIAVIIGEPGSGKSAHARWFVGQRRGAVLIEPDDLDCDSRWVVDTLFDQLRLAARNPDTNLRRDKKRLVVEFLQNHRGTVIVVDEAQKLRQSALEMLRRLQDLSDPFEGHRIAIALFGDERFYQLITQTREGGRTPISPQITRRMYPIFDISVHGRRDNGDGTYGDVYTEDDIKKLVRQSRLRVLRGNAEARWLTRLANLSGWGSLGQAMRVFLVAHDIREGEHVTVEGLATALTTILGPDEVDIVDRKTDGALNIAVAKAG